MSRLSEQFKRLDLRGKHIFFSAMSSLVAKSMGLVVIIFSLPITYRYLDAERFGVLSVLTSAIALLNFADLGLGLGLANRLPDFFTANPDERKVNRAVSSVFFVLAGLAIVMLLVFMVAEPFIDWGKLFNIKSLPAVQEARSAMKVLVWCFTLSLPFTVVQKVLFAQQKNYLNDIWVCAGHLLSIGLIFLFVHLRLGVPYLIGATYGISCLLIVLNFEWTFRGKLNREYRPRFRDFDLPLSRSLIRDGGIYFLLQLFAVLMNGLDPVFVAQLLTPAHVALYTVGFRLFQMMMHPVQVFIAPLLPAFNDAFSRNELFWVRKTFFRYARIVGLVSVLFASLFFFLANFAVKWWIDEQLQLDHWLLLSFAILVVYYNFNGLISNLVLNPRFLKFVFRVYTLTAIIAISLKLLMGKYFGLPGVILSSVVAGVFCYLLPVLLHLRKRGILSGRATSGAA